MKNVWSLTRIFHTLLGAIISLLMALHQVNNLVRTELDERNEQEAVLPSLQLLSSQSAGEPLSASIRMSVLWWRLIHEHESQDRLKTMPDTVHCLRYIWYIRHFGSWFYSRIQEIIVITLTLLAYFPQKGKISLWDHHSTGLSLCLCKTSPVTFEPISTFLIKFSRKAMPLKITSMPYF
jgi:hypothetical protein